MGGGGGGGGGRGEGVVFEDPNKLKPKHMFLMTKRRDVHCGDLRQYLIGCM